MHTAYCKVFYCLRRTHNDHTEEEKRRKRLAEIGQMEVSFICNVFDFKEGK